MRLHYCYVSCVVVPKTLVVRMVHTGVWCFLAIASQHASTLIQSQSANLYHGSLLSNVGHFCTIIVLNYPICEGDYVYSMKVD